MPVMHAQNKRLEVVFAAPRLIDGDEKRFDPKRLHAITEQFERKLIGVRSIEPSGATDDSASSSPFKAVLTRNISSASGGATFGTWLAR